MNSSLMTTIRNVTRLASPVLYGSSCVVVFVGGVVVAFSPAVVRYSEALPGSSYLFESAALAVVLLLLACALLFAAPGLAIYGLERLQSPGLKDHVRHCALLYAGILFVGVVLLTLPDFQAGMLQYDLGLAVCAVAAYGILVDAGVVLSKRRSTCVQLGGAF